MTVIIYPAHSVDERITRRRVLFNDYRRRRDKPSTVNDAARALLAEASAGGAGGKPPVNVVAVAEEPRKGVCQHCGNYIGRGVRLHEKRCGGADNG